MAHLPVQGRTPIHLAEMVFAKPPEPVTVHAMARQNYSSEKRRRELDKQHKKAEKKRRKLEQNSASSTADSSSDNATTPTTADAANPLG